MVVYNDVARDILAKLIADADQPTISIHDYTGKKLLRLHASGDPYYSVDCFLTDEEYDFLARNFPDMIRLYRSNK